MQFIVVVELEFSNNDFSHALCLEDVDNDGVSILMFSYSKSFPAHVFKKKPLLRL